MATVPEEDDSWLYGDGAGALHQQREQPEEQDVQVSNKNNVTAEFDEHNFEVC